MSQHSSLRFPPPSPPRTLLIGLLAPLAAACGSGAEGSGQAAIVRDSAGVTIVENPGDVWSFPGLRRLSTQPVVRIGALEGEEPYLFDGVRGVLPLPDGRIVVANAGSNALRWFDDEGGFLFERGGEGEGPGEFSYLGGITLWAGDSILAVDWSQRRVTTYAADGTFTGTAPLDGLPGPPGSVYRLSDGSLVAGVSGFSSTQLPPDQGPGVFRVPTPLVRIPADGSGVDTVGLFPGVEIWLREEERGRAFGPPAFPRNFHYAVGGDRIFVGTAESFRIDVYAPDGRLLRSIRAPGVDLRLEAAAIESYKERIRAAGESRSQEERAEVERTLASQPYPETLPAYAALLLDRGGRVWVSRYQIDPGPGGTWAVFDTEGRLSDLIRTPPRFRPWAITDDRLWGRETDELGVEYVAAYALEDGEPAR